VLGWAGERAVRGSIGRGVVALSVVAAVAAGGCFNGNGDGNGTTASRETACDLLTAGRVRSAFGTTSDYTQTKPAGGRSTTCSRTVVAAGRPQVVVLSMNPVRDERDAAARVRADRRGAQVAPQPVPEVADDAWWDDGLAELHWSEGNRWFVLATTINRSPKRREKMVALGRLLH
jgi:hypothetical protein